MRGEMAAHKKPSGGLDVKLLPGGLVDLEFVVHFYQLLHQEAFDPRLPQAIIGLASAGLVDARLGEAHDRLNRLLVCCRVLAQGLQEPEDVPPNVAARVAPPWRVGQWDT